MNIRMLYFAGVREMVGISKETLILKEAAPTLKDLCAHLRAKGGGREKIFSGQLPIKFAVNQQFADIETSLSDNCEVAIFPPVTGG